MSQSICHAHNLRKPLPEQRPYGIRVRMRPDDTFRNLIGEDWQKEHWFATREDRDAALAQMSGRYVYFRAGDAPSCVFEKIDP